MDCEKSPFKLMFVYRTKMSLGRMMLRFFACKLQKNLLQLSHVRAFNFDNWKVNFFGIQKSACKQINFHFLKFLLSTWVVLHFLNRIKSTLMSAHGHSNINFFERIIFFSLCVIPIETKFYPHDNS